MNEVVGWFGSLMFALCGFPQAWLSYKQGHSKGVSKLFILMWLIGELCYINYTLNKFGLIFPFFVNYFVNILFISVIIYFMVFPRNDN
jgi:uncharacterized protein with PQ loop repeat